MTVKEWLGEKNQLGIDIWEKKYRQNDESFDEWLDRVSGRNNDVKQLIISKKFLFGGRVLSNRKIDKKATYSNCYVLPAPEDNIESIFETAKLMARTYSYGGGIGFDLSNLAPNGAKINNTAKFTSGSISFMDLYSMVTGLIGQNGRRGALMLSMSADHPDIEDFIKCKTDLDRVTKANISVRASNKFMKAVKEDKDWELKFTRKETKETISKTVKAKDLFRLICEVNYDYAEPGLLFWDTVSKNNLLEFDNEFSYAGTNPCGEMPLPAGGACNLGSINLAEFVGEPFTEYAYVDYLELANTVKIATRALNEILHEGIPKHPLDVQKDSVDNWRQIGLGVMGISDMLIKLGIRYGSKRACEVLDNVMRTIANEAFKESYNLADKYGSYPKFKVDKVNRSKFYNRLDFKSEQTLDKLANSQLLTIAPTGTLSTMLGISGGIEPIFANSYNRTTQSLHDEGEVTYKVYTPIVDAYMKANDIKKEEDLPEFFVTAKDINWKDRINMQASAQRWIDGAISSTLNVPENFTIENVMEAYMYAWEAGLKGITMFRDNCKRIAILNTNSSKEEKTTVIPENLIGKRKTLTTGCGSLHLQAFFDGTTGEIKEVFLAKGSTGGCNNFMIGLSRMISLAARNGISTADIVDQLNSCGVCPSYAVRRATKGDTSPGSCCPVAVGKALLDLQKEIQNEIGIVSPKKTEEKSKKEKIKKNDIKNESSTKCPECGEDLHFEGGCNICKNCGYSKCS